MINELVISKKFKLYVARTMMPILSLAFLYVTWVSPLDKEEKQLPLAKGNMVASVVRKKLSVNPADSKKHAPEEQKPQTQIMASYKAAVEAGKLLPSSLQKNHDHEETVCKAPKKKAVSGKAAAKYVRRPKTKPSKSLDREVTFVGLADSVRERIACAAIILHFEGSVENGIRQLGGVRADHAQGIDTGRFLVNVRGSKRFFGVTIVEDGHPVKFMLPSDRQMQIWDAIARKTNEKIKMDKTSMVTMANVQFNGRGQIVSVDVVII